MTRKEEREIHEEKLYLYSGILFANQKFAAGTRQRITYRMDCPEFETLRETYGLSALAGKGGDFARAKRLMHGLAPRLSHSPWYDGHVPGNALDLLAYSLDRPEQGINCVSKAKILQECCLALGIYARRVFIMPYSAYDFDNHVVTEIYDREMGKWILLDPSADGFFVDGENTPLSALEIRERFARDQFVTFVKSAEARKDLKKLWEKHLDVNTYLCKNLFWFDVDQECGFGPSEKSLYFCPEHFSVKENRLGNMHFRINHIPEGYEAYLDYFQTELEEARKAPEPERADIWALLAAPWDEE